MFQLAWPASWVGIDISVKELVSGGSGSSFVGGEMGTEACAHSL